MSIREPARRVRIEAHILTQYGKSRQTEAVPRLRFRVLNIGRNLRQQVVTLPVDPENLERLALNGKNVKQVSGREAGSWERPRARAAAKIKSRQCLWEREKAPERVEAGDYAVQREGSEIGLPVKRCQTVEVDEVVNAPDVDGELLQRRNEQKEVCGAILVHEVEIELNYYTISL